MEVSLTVFEVQVTNDYYTLCFKCYIQTFNATTAFRQRSSLCPYQDSLSSYH